MFTQPSKKRADMNSMEVEEAKSVAFKLAAWNQRGGGITEEGLRPLAQDADREKQLFIHLETLQHASCASSSTNARTFC